MEFKEWSHQEDIQYRFMSLIENETYLPIYVNIEEEVKHGFDDFFVYSFLIDNERISTEISSNGFNQFKGYPSMEQTNFGKEGEIEYKYFRFGQEEQEPLIYRRRFTSKEDYEEVSQEFVHFFNLYYDRTKNNYYLIDEDGNEELIIKITDGNWYIKTYRLKQYLAFKEKALVIGIVNSRYFNKKLSTQKIPSDDYPLVEFSNESINFQIWYQTYGGDWSFFTEFLGKRIIKGMPIENTGIYPYEKKRNYEEFIIGINQDGNFLSYSCNPELLANFFGKNSDAPHYLTRVYFSRDVLSKNYQNPQRFQVGDGYIKIGDYRLRADTNHPNYVMVFLGDLGRNLPNSEQQYWKSKNITPEEGMSKVYFKRSIEGNWANPDAAEFIFINQYKELLTEWKKTFGWDLLKELNQEDLYRLETLHVPLSENQYEFDTLIQNLTIILIDSLNVNGFNSVLHDVNLLTKENKNLQSIKKLEKIFEILEFSDFDTHITFLTELYALRTRGSSHRKGSKEYTEAIKHFKIDEKGLINVFTELLNKANIFMSYLLNMAKEKKEK